MSLLSRFSLQWFVPTLSQNFLKLRPLYGKEETRIFRQYLTFPAIRRPTPKLVIEDVLEGKSTQFTD